MRRIIRILVLTTALVTTLATSAFAGSTVPCVFGCFGMESAPITFELR